MVKNEQIMNSLTQTKTKKYYKTKTKKNNLKTKTKKYIKTKITLIDMTLHVRFANPICVPSFVPRHWLVFVVC